MGKILACSLVGALTLASFSAQGAALSRNLTSDEFSRATQLIGIGSSHRAWTGHAMEGEGAGFTMGLEAAILLRGDLMEMGDGSAVLTQTIPVPRLWVSGDFPMGVQASASLSPAASWGGITTLGLGAQWAYLRFADYATSFSALFDYTYVNAFGDLKSHNFGLKAQVSRDLVYWQPYAGAGMILARASDIGGIRESGERGESAWVPDWHAYIGARLDFVAKVSAQLDLYGGRPGFAFLLAHQF